MNFPRPCLTHAMMPKTNRIAFSFKTFLRYLFYHLVKQVARPAHKKKARMARTRSDFLTRGTFADGEGDTEEDDYDDNFEFLLSSDQPTHPEPGPTARLGQACHSDSEMVIFTTLGKQKGVSKCAGTFLC